MKTKVLYFLVAITACSSAAYAECNPADFRTEKWEDLSDIEKLAQLDTMSQTELNKRIAKSGGKIGFKGFSLGGSHREVKANIKKMVEHSELEKFSDYKKSWATTNMTSEDLSAYKSCLAANRDGFSVDVMKAAENEAIAKVMWHGAVKSQKPKIVSSTNIDEQSIKAASRRIETEDGWQETFFEHNLRFTKNNTDSASVDIKMGGQTKTLVFPPAASSIEIKIPNQLLPNSAPNQNGCEARKVRANQETYWVANKSLAVGGGSTINSDRAFIQISEDCTATLNFSAGMQSSGEHMPDNSSAPSMFVQLIDKSGNPIVEDGIEPAVIVNNCGGYQNYAVPIGFGSGERAKQIGSFDIRLSNASPKKCN